jgi:DNA-binding NarL/FixJ family response regulator
MLRILIADDFAPWRSYLRSLLEGSGFQVVGEAEDGLQAVARAEALQPDLVLLDFAMPKLNGIEAAERIRKISPKSEILFVSVERSPEFAEAVRRVGARGCILKPDVQSKLLPAIDALRLGK